MIANTDSIITVYDSDGNPLIVDGKATKAGEELVKNNANTDDQKGAAK